MTGGLEPNSTPEMSHRMADLSPEGAVAIVETAAHMMPMTHPADVNQALLEFAGGCRK
jgi:pimeloyl-ACP methyl ester carboxylesterase